MMPQRLPVLPTTRPSTGPSGLRRFDPLRDLITLAWLIAAAAVVALHWQVPHSRWLLIHLVLAGAVSHSILVWSQYFADTLLHNPPMPLRARRARIVLLNGGVATIVITLTAGGPWPIVLAGACCAAVTACWHGLSLWRQLCRSISSRFAPLIRYYLTAAALLPLGITCGVLMSHGMPGNWADRLLVAHVILNVLGWVGLTVLGTQVTLWPTMLRTQVADGGERAARRAFVVLVTSVCLAAAGAVAGVRFAVATGLVGYGVGLVLLAVPFVTTLRRKPPIHFPGLSALAALAWLAGLVIAYAVILMAADGWAQATDQLSLLTPGFAAGFAAQILLGALSYLIPVGVGGGPSSVRAANKVLDAGGALRVTVVNAGLLLYLLPVPSWVRVCISTLVAAAFALFLPLLVLAIRAARRTRRAVGSQGWDHAAGRARADARGTASTTGAGTVDAAARANGAKAPVAGLRPRGQIAGLVAVGLTLVVAAVVGGAAVDPAALAGATREASDAGVTPTGETTYVEVTAHGMSFTPNRIEVPVGNRLVITVHNTDPSNVHDLVLDTGAGTARLAPGESAELDAGVIGRTVDGWCSVPGHRQMGMELQIVATGDETGPNSGGADPVGGGDPTDGHEHDSPGTDPAAAPRDPNAAPDPNLRAFDAAVPAISQEAVIRRTFRVSDTLTEVAPGITQTLWTYNGTAPGPVLHAQVGDTFEITLVNDTEMGHSIDFHAGQVAPDEPMRTIAPGESLVYRFTVNHSGIWLYHCSTMPMSAHIANGMFGAVIVDPPGLAPVDREYVLVQSELYLGEQGGVVDVDKVNAERPDLVVFNGYANYYDTRPLAARAGERVRLWLLNAGPNRASAFHVVGGQFDTVFSEGSYLVRPDNAELGGSQVLPLAPAQGGFVELEFNEPGRYPFVSHSMVDAERGAHGIIEVSEAP
jgi:nitrite reductase (NO-forming)